MKNRSRDGLAAKGLLCMGKFTFSIPSLHRVMFSGDISIAISYMSAFGC